MSRRVILQVLCATLLAVLGAAGGCSPPPNAKQIGADVFPQAYAQALCESLDHCCTENAVTYSQQDCTAGWRAIIAARLQDSVLLANYDPKAATDCVNRVRDGANVSCDPVDGSISAARDTCQQIFLGKKALGDSCRSSAECAPQPDARVVCEGLPNPDSDAGLLPLATGVHPLAGPPGPPVCVALPLPQAGDLCPTPALISVCESSPDLFCDRTDSVCKPLADEGAPCTTGGCKTGLFCQGGVCSPQLGVGGACTSSDACESLLRCDGRSCVSRLQPGSACTADADCSIGTCDSVTKRCLKNAIATSATCRGRER